MMTRFQAKYGSTAPRHSAATKRFFPMFADDRIAEIAERVLGERAGIGAAGGTIHIVRLPSGDLARVARGL